jgi:hypothetical protein
MSASIIFVGFGAITSVLLVAKLLGHETFTDALMDFALGGVLLGLGAFVILTAIRLVRDRHR